MRVAQLQAGIVCLWLAVVLAWLLWHGAQAVWAVFGALALASAHAWVLALEFMAQRWVCRHDRTPRARAAQLLRAWVSEIGVAMGVLMAKHNITRDQAFGLLRVASQDSNRRLAELAVEVADTGELPLRRLRPTPR